MVGGRVAAIAPLWGIVVVLCLRGFMSFMIFEIGTFCVHDHGFMTRSVKG